MTIDEIKNYVKTKKDQFNEKWQEEFLKERMEQNIPDIEYFRGCYESYCDLYDKIISKNKNSIIHKVDL